MSPTRGSQRPSSLYQPYSRNRASSGSSGSSNSACSSPTQSMLQEYPPFPTELTRSMPRLLDNTPESRPGFPTYAQYKTLEAAYLNGLTPKRQSKALVSQSLFDRIWDTLRQPETTTLTSYSAPTSPAVPSFNSPLRTGFSLPPATTSATTLQPPNLTNIETPQFRFWVRKMFTVGRTDDPKFEGKPFAHGPPREILLHVQDHLQVAIQEQLYDILCYCHGQTNHGGRDKTCSMIRKNYAWVPKELVAQFVKACPTCIVKKCGHSDFKSLYQLGQNPNLEASTDASLSPRQPKSNKKDDGSLPELRDYLQELAAKDAANPEADEDPWRSMDSFDNDILGQFPSHSPNPGSSTLSSHSQSSGSSGSSVQSHGMSREVSLYHGMPNGWQYHSDYNTARAGLLKERTQPTQSEPYPPTAPVVGAASSSRCGRPRVPSVAPLTFQDRMTARFAAGHENRLRRNTLPPLQLPGGQKSDEGLPPSLQPLRVLPVAQNVSSPVTLMRNANNSANSGDSKGEFLSKIDPLLLELSSLANAENVHMSPLMTSTPRISAYETAPVSSPTKPSASLHRTGAPHLLDLPSPSPRGTLSGDTLMARRYPKSAYSPPSPRSRDITSQFNSDPFHYRRNIDLPDVLERRLSPGMRLKLSSGPSPMTTTNSVSPATSSLPTPTEECDQKTTTDIVEGFDLIRIQSESGLRERSNGGKQVHEMINVDHDRMNTDTLA